MVVHSGSIRGGHYYSYIKNEEGWFWISDSRVKPVKKEDVHISQPYILFYRPLK